MSDLSNSIETQLALIRADTEEIRHILLGDSEGHKGLVEQVNELTRYADRGLFVLRVALWSGSAIAAAAAGIVHFKQTPLELFRQ